MAVVNRHGSLIMTGLMAVPASLPVMGRATARVHSWVDTVEVASGDSAGSTFTLARLPSGVIVLPQSTLHFDAIAGLSDADFGGAADPDALVDGQSMTTAGTVGALAAVDRANYGRRLWEHLGYGTDPRRVLDLSVTLKADASASGTLTAVLLYADS